MINVYWDIDDVLVSTMKSFLDYYDFDIDYNDIKTNPPCDHLNISYNKYIELLDDFRKNKFMNLLPDNDIYTFFKEDGFKFSHTAVTSCPANLAHVSAKWLFTHFYEWFNNFILIPSSRSRVINNTFYLKKLDFITKNNLPVDIFIDDVLSNFDNAPDTIKCMLFKQPWNKGIEKNEILDYLRSF